MNAHVVSYRTLRNNGLTSVRREDLVNYTSLETLSVKYLEIAAAH